MKKIRLAASVFTFFILLSQFVEAQTLSGEIIYPTARLKSEILDYLKQYNPSAGQFKEDHIIPVDFPYIMDDVRYKYSWLNANIEIEDEKSILAKIQGAEINFLVPHVSVDTTIVKYVEGVVVKIKVKSECSNINLNLKADWVNLKLAQTETSKNPFDFGLEAVDLDYQKPILTMNEFSCTNIQGLEAEIKENLFENFNQLNLYQEVFLKKLNELIQSKIQSSLLSIKKTIRQNLNAIGLNEKLRVKSLNSQLMILQFSINKDLNSELQPIPEGLLLDKEQLIINVNKDDFTQFAIDMIKDKTRKNFISSKNIKAVNKLTQSRFQQFFVWPALMKRPKGQELIFKPTIESLKLNINENTFTNKVKIEFVTGLWTFDLNAPMVYFRSKFNTDVSINQKQQLSMSIENLKSKAIWDANYLSDTKCSKRISTNIIDSISENTFNQNWAKQNLSPFVFGQGQDYKFKDVYNHKNKFLYFRLEKLK